LIDCPDRRLTRAAVELCAETLADGDTEVSLLLPRIVHTRAWHRLLHDQTADAVAAAVADLAHANVTFVPYHLGSVRRREEQDAGGADTSRSDRLDEDLSRALREVGKISAALKAAQDRQRAAVADAARAELSGRWDKAEALAEARGAAAGRLARSMEAFVSDLQAFRKATADLTAALTAALPGSLDRDAAILTADLVEIAVRKELQRLGVPWEFSWPYGAVSIPPFAEAFEATPALIRQWRESAMARAASVKG